MRWAELAIFIGAWIALALRWTKRLRARRLSRIHPVELPNLNEGWFDIRLPIAKVSQTSPGYFHVATRGLYEGKELGLSFNFNAIDPNIDFLSNPSGGQLAATPNGVVFTSQGSPTHNLIQLYASLIGKPSSRISVPSAVKLTAITLEGNPTAIDQSKSKIKVFHRDDDPDGPYYFEMYVNSDVPNGWIELSEKDPDYREPFLRSFGAEI